ncbi:hypothetical protein STW0522PSE72_19620 [Pseudomonas monteilii]|nr:hypothetical protein STW0522PSE72_19620 [Pseudomonas monteilii]
MYWFLAAVPVFIYWVFQNDRLHNRTIRECYELREELKELRQRVASLEIDLERVQSGR